MISYHNILSATNMAALSYPLLDEMILCAFEHSPDLYDK